MSAPGAREAKGELLSKVDVYLGDYITIDDVTKEESERLASNECMVGAPVTLKAQGDDGIYEVVDSAGNSIGRIKPKNRLAIKNAFENDWTCHCWLSLVYFVDAEKLFHGEIVYQFHKVKPSQTADEAALCAFEEGIGEMLAAGKRPVVKLTGNQYDDIVENGGTFRPTDEEPLPFSTKRGSGVAVFKRKRSVSDKMAMAALDHNPGCRIAMVAVMLVIVCVIAFFVWRCTQG